MRFPLSDKQRRNAPYWKGAIDLLQKMVARVLDVRFGSIAGLQRLLPPHELALVRGNVAVVNSRVQLHPLRHRNSASGRQLHGCSGSSSPAGPGVRRAPVLRTVSGSRLWRRL